MGRFGRSARPVAVLLSLLCGLAACTNDTPPRTDTTMRATDSNGASQQGDGQGGSGQPPQVVPQPRSMVALDQDVRVDGKVSLVTDPLVDQPTRDLARRVLKSAGASEVIVRRPGREIDDATLRVRLGQRQAPSVIKAVQRFGLEVPEAPQPESYVLAAEGGDDPTVVMGASDPAGAYYAVQTLRQLVTPGRIAGVGVVDEPQMATRGAVEGFYGSPWTHQERMDQLAFYGSVKLNNYIYAPKDDPYHRERWREPYPAKRFARLKQLIGQAAAHHVNFTFALSPGMSICYSDTGDRQALLRKLQTLYDAGVRSFSVPLDDISYTEWNCGADRRRYGAPSPGAAGRAQAELLNMVQRDFIADHPGTLPLQMVPTEYSDMEDSAYKSVLRESLSPEVRVMWTGDGVIPEEITTADARAAKDVWKHELLLWDNYPVNDFDATEGLMMLGPYAKRANGLHEHLDGVLVNPMNQAAASKVVEIGAADFAWNSAAFDPQRAWRQAAEYLAGDRFAGDEQRLRPDPATVNALMTFFDLNHTAPLPDGQPWLEPAPRLRARIDEFTRAWNEGGDRAAALAEFRGYAQGVAEAPELIRQGAPKNFVSDVEPWLRATDLWGEALLTTLDGLDARLDGDAAGAKREFSRAEQLAQQAESVRTVQGETRPQGPVRVADGVLNKFIRQAPELP